MSIPTLDLADFLELKKPAMFYVNTLENHLHENKALIEHPHKHDFYLFVLFTQGSGTHEIDFETHSVEPGAIFCLNPGQTHHWNLSEDTRGYILFHTDFGQKTETSFQYLPFYQRVHNHPKIELTLDQLPVFTQSLEQIYTEIKENKPYKWKIVTAQLEVMYIQLARIYLAFFPFNGQATLQMNRIRKFELLVDQHIHDEKQVIFYAEKMHLSSRQLNRILQQAIGKTALEYIHDQLILEAKRLLVNPHLRFSEIATQLGFEEYAAFSAFFKKKTRFSPKEFRNSYK